MKKREFRRMIKEIVCEVITEMEDGPPLERDSDFKQSDDDSDSPADTGPVPTPTSKGLKRHARMSRVLSKFGSEQRAKDPKNKWSWPNKE